MKRPHLRAAHIDRRPATIFVAASLAVGMSIGPAAAHTATAAMLAPSAPSAPNAAASIDTSEITAGSLRVTVADDFPQVVRYDLRGDILPGQEDALDSFSINGATHRAVTIGTIGGDTATYVSTFPDLPGVTVSSSLRVNANDTVDFDISDISGDASSSVHEIAIPNHSLVSITSNMPQASLARTAIDTDATRSADRFIELTPQTPVDDAPVPTPYGFVNHESLAAGIVTNATDDTDVAATDNSNNRLSSHITEYPHGEKAARLSVGNWTWAPTGATDARVTRFQPPHATIVLASDRNGTGDVTWQDAAIAYRAVAEKPLGSQRVPERVVQHVPFNFGSFATNPFLKSADNIKRIAQNTDGLGQWALQKGYGSEGHDSANTDYGGNYNIRAGGLDDFTELTRIAADHNADIAVHVNATEAYAQSEAFSDRLVQGGGLGWNWLNQSHVIDQRYDLGSGAILDRFEQLRREAPGVKTVYIDVYYSDGWLANGLARELRKMGFEVATEWAYKFEGSSVWAHWANDKNYGGTTNKGINSNIVRFIANSDRDVWNSDPLLGGEELVEFEGWTGQNNWNEFLTTVWRANLPTKFLQHFELEKWDFGTSATLSDDVTVRVDNGTRVISMGGREVLRGDSYLLPWGSPTDAGTTSPRDARKMYYFSASGGTHHFPLTEPFAGSSTFTQYALSDQGRTPVRELTASTDGVLTLIGDPGTAYVVEPSGQATPAVDANYGEGSGLVDPGVNSGTAAPWNPTGTVTVERNAVGDNVLGFGEAASSIHQNLQGLEPGARYSFAADIEIADAGRRAVTLAGGPAADVSERTFDTTPLLNTNAADSKKGTSAQRASVSFTADQSGTAQVSIRAAAGPARIVIDDLRVMRDTSTPFAGRDVVAASDFEGNQPGWGPFVKGEVQGYTDPRGSISVLRHPFSQQEWKNTHEPYDRGSVAGQAVDDVLTGDHSLKMHDVDATGIAYRTVPATARLLPGHEYRVSFTYQSNVADQWQWVRGLDTVRAGSISSPVIARKTLAPALKTTPFTDQFVAGCDDTWVGLNRSGTAPRTDFVIDDVTIVDLGESPGGPSCATVTTPTPADFSPGIATPLVTTFTNTETDDVHNVGVTLEGLPDGWKVDVQQADGNVFAQVAPGQSVSTTWLVTPPAGAELGRVTWRPTATYRHRCAVKSVDAEASGAVTSTPTVPAVRITATADSESGQTGDREGPATNLLDGDLGTIWHTRYTPAIDQYPHAVTLDLGEEHRVTGLGYQGRTAGNDNGRVGSYRIEGSSDGVTWTELTSGTLTGTPDMQAIDLSETTTKHLRFTALDALNGQPFASAAEMRVYGTPTTPATGFTPAARAADDTTGCGGGEPTPQPTDQPQPQPTTPPTDQPTPAPTPTAVPTAQPTPTTAPTPQPTPAPTPEPTPTTTPAPTAEPTPQPQPTETPAVAFPGTPGPAQPTPGPAPAPDVEPRATPATAADHTGLAHTGNDPVVGWITLSILLTVSGALLLRQRRHTASNGIARGPAAAAERSVIPPEPR